LPISGANLALMDELNRVQVPALSASFHRRLLDPPGQYNFFISTNYDNHVRVLIDYAVSQHKGSQPPRIAFSVHPSPYGRSPLEAGRTYAEQLGLNVVASQELPADVLDATGQVLELRRAGAEYVFFQNVAQPVSVFLRDARRQGLRAQFLGIHYAGGEELLHLAGRNADGFITTSATVTWDTDVPGMEFVKALNARYHPNVAVRPPHYTQGVVTAMVLMEAVKRASAPTGAAVKDALETIKDFDAGGLTPPITFGPNRHWGADSLYLYRLDANQNRLVFLGEFSPNYEEGETMTQPATLGTPLARSPAAAPGAAEPLLTVNNIEVVYHDVILVLKGVSLVVPKGQIVALLGTNGAGKSTTLKASAGLLSAEEGRVRQGSIIYQGRDIAN